MEEQVNEGEREGKKHMMQNPSGKCCPVLSQVRVTKGFLMTWFTVNW